MFSIATVGPSTEHAHRRRTGAEWVAFVGSLAFDSLAGWTSQDYWIDTNGSLATAGVESLPLFAVIASDELGEFGTANARLRP
jgi:hypothetical protein